MSASSTGTLAHLISEKRPRRAGTEARPTEEDCYWQAPGILAPARKERICAKACCAAGVFFRP